MTRRRSSRGREKRRKQIDSLLRDVDHSSAESRRKKRYAKEPEGKSRDGEPCDVERRDSYRPDTDTRAQIRATRTTRPCGTT
jgi:hypothetical protein